MCRSQFAALFAALAAFSSTAAVSAQASATETSPAGHLQFDGNSRTLLLESSQRLQQIDNTLVGVPRIISGIAFRSDLGGEPLSPPTGPRTLDVRVRLDEVPMGRLVNEFNDNFVQPIEVVARRTVTMPDWTQTVGAAVAPADFVIDFDVPFQYLGQGSLMIDVDWIHLSSEQPVWFDAVEEDVLVSDPFVYGSGCAGSSTPNPPVLTMLFSNAGSGMSNYGMRLLTRIESGVPFSPVFVFLDTEDRGLTVPGLCGEFRTNGLLQFYAGDTNSAGLLDYQHVCLPYGAGLQGVELIAQAIQPDFASAAPIALALSSAARNTMPVNNSGMTQEVAFHYVSTVSPDNAYSEVLFGQGLVIELR